MTLCVMPVANEKTLAASRSAVEDNRKRQQREIEEAKLANASATEITNLPNIAETQYSKSSEPHRVSEKLSNKDNLSATDSKSSLANAHRQTASPLLIAPNLSEVLTSVALRSNKAVISQPMPEPMPTPTGHTPFDFDGDGKSDVGRWRSGNSSNQWSILKSSNGQTETHTLGSGADFIVPMYYNNDALADYAVFNAGSWTIHVNGGSTATHTWGTSGDVPVAADYDGDGKADMAVFRPSTGTWWILTSSSSYASYTSISLGQSGDITAQADYDGDGKTDAAVFRPSNGYWYIQKSSTNSVVYIPWGTSGDVPAMGDYDGDGLSDCAIYRPSSGTWWALKSSDNNNSWFVQTWGNYGDQAVPADYDGDGKTDYAVWRPSTGVWYIVNSSSSSSSSTDEYSYKQLGISTDVAIPSAYIKKTGANISPDLVAKERLSPKNRTGGNDLYSRNIHWSTGLAGLSGRSGLGAGISLSYNSLIWIKQDTNIIFDPDTSNITPGFRFGFPLIEPLHTNEETHQGAFMLVSPSGARTELRQSAATNVFESADSSYIQLKVDEAQSPNDPVENLGLTLYMTDGTKMRYVWKGGAYRCSEIKDSNGNYITITHDEYGLLRTIKDTLERIITINYNDELLPTTITQTWGTSSGTTTHTWATFTYTSTTINSSFGSLTVYGPPNGTTIKVLSKITYSDGSSARFDYNSYGQVYQIASYAADNHFLNYVKFDIDSPSSPQSDCPRFTTSKVKAEYWNTDTNGNPQEVTTSYAISDNQTYTIDGTSQSNLRRITITSPDGTVDKIYSRQTGWDESLPLLSETYSSDNTTTPKRSVISYYTQDNTNLSYILNPRVTETKIVDSANTKRATVSYHMLSETSPISKYGLVKDVIEYNYPSTTSQLRRTHIEYNLNEAYVSRRIIGLVSERTIYGATDDLAAKTTFSYDEGSFGNASLNQDISPVQHDNTNFGASFVTGRGNLTSVSRYNVNEPTIESQSLKTQTKYNTAGSPVSTLDAIGNETRISYAESYKDGNNTRNTYAYPTGIFDPENTTSVPTAKTEYDFYRGVVTRTEGKAPLNQTQGAIVTREYNDPLGRLTKITTVNDGSYVRYEYPDTDNLVKIFATVTANQGEAYSAVYTDGLGRTIRTVGEHTFDSNNATATYAIAKTEYDEMGRVKKQFVPTEATETNGVWNLAGDDITRGWLWTSYTYDWKGRVLTTTNTDNTVTEAVYEGCGCAGGEIITLKGEVVAEGRRQQKIYKDILGRTYKTQILSWDNSIYSTTRTTYDTLDRATSVTQYNGDEFSNNFCSVEQQNQGLCQITTTAYDGYGRIYSKHLPQQGIGEFTFYEYYANNQLKKITDGRGAWKNLAYNGRGLVSQITYGVLSGSDITVPATVEFDYDDVGNRIWMTDGLGRADYEYDELSRMKSETRQFNDSLSEAPLSNNRYKISYTYALSNKLSSLTDPFGSTIYYGYDKIGRLKEVTGTYFGSTNNYASNAQYRSWGDLKHLDYGNGLQMNMTFNNRLKPATFKVDGSGQLVMEKSYTYYDDGGLRYTKDWRDAKFDRLNKYDHVGRVIQARTGAEAREQTESNSQNLPYHYNYTYDAFGHMTSRSGTHWIVNDGWSYSFVNDRGPADAFDDDGRVTATSESSPYGNVVNSSEYKYDANGALEVSEQTTTYFEEHTNEPIVFEGKLDYDKDGDGRQIKTTKTDYVDGGQTQVISTKYFIRSSVLGGQVLTDVFGDGRKTRTLVYAAGTVLAWQVVVVQPQSNDVPEVWWEYKDPGNNSVEVRDHNRTHTFTKTGWGGISMTKAELDPNGGDTGLEYSVVLPPPPAQFPGTQSPGGGFDEPPEHPYLPRGMEPTYVIDGIPMSEGAALNFIRAFINAGAIDYIGQPGSLSPYFGGVGLTPRYRWVDNPPDTGDACVNGVCPDIVTVNNTGGHYELDGFEGDGSWETGQTGQQLAPLEPTKIAAINNAMSEIASRLEKELISEKCRKNVIDKLKTLSGFDLNKFIDFLKAGGNFYDGTKSQASAAEYFPNQGYSATQTIADTFKRPRGIVAARVSGRAANTGFTVFFTPNEIDRGNAESLISGKDISGIKSANLAFLFHESLHGYGFSVGALKGNYADEDLQKLFGLTVGAASINISDYIEENCFSK